MERSSERVFAALRYCVRSWMSFLVRRTWAMGWFRFLKSSSHNAMRRHWPIAASAWSVRKFFGDRQCAMGKGREGKERKGKGLVL